MKEFWRVWAVAARARARARAGQIVYRARDVSFGMRHRWTSSTDASSIARDKFKLETHGCANVRHNYNCNQCVTCIIANERFCLSSIETI